MKFKSQVKSWLSVILAASIALPTVLSLFGIISIRNVLSDSMSPKININDVVVSANWLKPGLGDVAIYHQRDISGTVRQDVVHRIITISASGEYQFKGDHNKSMDALAVPRADIVGKVLIKIPGLGSLFNPWGFITLIIFGGGIYSLYFGLKNLRKSKSEAD